MSRPSKSRRIRRIDELWKIYNVIKMYAGKASSSGQIFFPFQNDFR